jgi:hypothetical protein
MQPSKQPTSIQPSKEPSIQPSLIPTSLPTNNTLDTISLDITDDDHIKSHPPNAILMFIESTEGKYILASCSFIILLIFFIFGYTTYHSSSTSSSGMIITDNTKNTDTIEQYQKQKVSITD